MTLKQLNALMRLYFRQRRIVQIDYSDGMLRVEYVDNGGNHHKEGYFPEGTFITTYPV